MKVARITKYSKDTHLTINDAVIPGINDNEVLVKVKAAGVKYDKMAEKQRKEYHFFFVKANGE